MVASNNIFRDMAHFNYYIQNSFFIKKKMILISLNYHQECQLCSRDYDVLMHISQAEVLQSRPAAIFVENKK